MVDNKINISLPFTGERYVPEVEGQIEMEHLHRYALALEYAKGKNVLDIASGEGYGANLLSQVAKSVTGVDISEEAINHAKQKYVKNNLSFIQGSADSIPCETNIFDLVVSFETIEHHDKHIEMLQEIKRVLKPEGVLILSSPDKTNYTDIPRYQNPFHVKELYVDELRSLMAKYFRFSKMYFQKVEYSSIIAAEKNNSSFSEIWGDYLNLHYSNILQNPIYDIIIASDYELSNLGISIFNGKKVFSEIILNIERTTVELGRTIGELEQTKGELNRVYRSRTWRWGNKIADFVMLLVPENSLRRKIMNKLEKFEKKQ